MSQNADYVPERRVTFILIAGPNGLRKLYQVPTLRLSRQQAEERTRKFVQVFNRVCPLSWRAETFHLDPWLNALNLVDTFQEGAASEIVEGAKNG